MKTPAFWYKPPRLLANMLAPLGFLYRLGATARRIMASPYRAKIPVICIGNIVAGGAGKTPVALAIAEMLIQGGAKPVFVTRGYGGGEHGPLKVDPLRHTAGGVGDEALLLARMAPTWIGHNRAATIKAAEPFGTHIIMDDGLQNPSIRPSLSFLVVDGRTGFGNGRLIPAGPLRETFEDAMKRITAIILIGENEDRTIAGRAQCPILRAHMTPDLPPDFQKTRKFFAFAGIGRPEKFYQTCRNAGLTLAGTQDFPDHYAFTAADLAALKKKAAAQKARLLTTEKDWVRLPDDMRGEVTPLPVKLIFDDPEAIKRLTQSS